MIVRRLGVVVCMAFALALLAYAAGRALAGESRLVLDEPAEQQAVGGQRVRVIVEVLAGGRCTRVEPGMSCLDLVLVRAGGASQELRTLLDGRRAVDLGAGDRIVLDLLPPLAERGQMGGVLRAWNGSALVAESRWSVRYVPPVEVEFASAWPPGDWLWGEEVDVVWRVRNMTAADGWCERLSVRVVAGGTLIATAINRESATRAFVVTRLRPQPLGGELSRGCVELELDGGTHSAYWAVGVASAAMWSGLLEARPEEPVRHALPRALLDRLVEHERNWVIEVETSGCDVVARIDRLRGHLVCEVREAQDRAWHATVTVGDQGLRWPFVLIPRP